MIRALIFLGFVAAGFSLALLRGPFWGLETYALIYFIQPDPEISWWVKYLPLEARWSLLATGVMVLSLILHKNSLVRRDFKSLRWAFIFIFLTGAITLFVYDQQPDALRYTIKLISYLIAVWFIVKVIQNVEQFRIFLFTLIIGIGYLSFLAFTEGKRIHARLENIGASDTVGANEFGLFLGGVMPLMVAFLLSGKWYERLVCVLILPFAFNAFILCNSRGAAVALCLSVFYVGVFIADKKFRKILFGALIFSIPLFIYMTDAEFIERITSLWKTETVLEQGKSMNQISSGRIEIWNYGIKMVNDHPWGAGPNSFKHLARFYMPPEILTFHSGDEYGVRAAHNTYLQVLVEQGYIGFVLWLIMCIHTILLLKKTAKQINRLNLSGSFLGLSVLGLNISFMCTILGGLFNSRLYYEFFWWQMALSVVAYSLVLKAGRDLKEEQPHFKAV